MAEDVVLPFDFVRHAIHHYRALGWPAQVAIGLGLPVASFLLGLAVVVGLPADFFVRLPQRRGFWHSHPLLRGILVVAKNLFGVVMFVVGFVMALPLVPGPGVLFMLVGLALVDFPGKRSLERRLLREPHVLSSVNKVRARFGKPPLQTEDPTSRSVVDSGA